MAKINNQSQITSKYTLPDQTEQQATTQSNVASTENMTTSFLKQQTSPKLQVLRGETITQTLTLTNNSELVITNINIKEVISNDGTFKPGSVKINDVSYENFNIVTGFNLPEDIQPNSSTKITFDVEIKQEPVVDVVNLVAVVKYETDNLVFEENSNVIALEVLNQSLSVTKSANKKAVIKGQTITFVNLITNNGSIINTDVFFKDELPEGTEFVAGSVKIDNTPREELDPTKGFAISDLNPNDEINITFDVLVKLWKSL